MIVEATSHTPNVKYFALILITTASDFLNPSRRRTSNIQVQNSDTQVQIKVISQFLANKSWKLNFQT